MKITDIQIERYGVWRHLALPLPSPGLNVFYGPNEAGKTTLLRFIRDVLYGPQSADEARSDWHGALRLAEADRFCELRRWYERDGSQGIEFQELDPQLAWSTEPDWGLSEEAAVLTGEAAESALQELLAGTKSRLFRHVFAIGLNELQELATLQDEEVAEEIYSLSLGPQGRTLLSATSQIGAVPAKSPWAAEAVREIHRLMEQDAELARELEQFSGRRDRHRELTDRIAETEAEIEDLNTRLTDRRQQLSGHETLKRVWEPWNQVREYEAQLRLLPALGDVSGIDAAELSALENEIRELARQRKSAVGEIRRLRKSLRSSTKDAAPRKNATALQSFLNERDAISEIDRELELASARSRELQTEFEARQKVLGGNWPIERLVAVDTGHSAYTRLVDAARSFQSAQDRLSAFRKRYEKQASACQQRQTEWEQRIEILPEPSLEEAVRTTREQLANLEDLTRLTRQQSELEHDIARRKRELNEWRERSQIPSWVPGFLLFLAGSGMVLSALGFYTSLTSNGIAGAILALVGIAGFSIAKAFRVDNEDQVEEELTRIASGIANEERRLEEVRTTIGRHLPEAWAVKVMDAELSAEGLEAALAARLEDRLSELAELEAEQRRLKSRRRRLSRMRKALQNRQRKVGQARQEWCQVLKQTGLDENHHIEEAFGLWQKIAEAMEHYRAWNEARETAVEIQKRHEAFCRRLAEFGRRIGRADLDYNHPLRVLAVLEKELASAGKDNHEHAAWKRELREWKEEAKDLKHKMIEARKARRSFLGQVGASCREEFESRLQAARRRAELEELLQMAKEELAAAHQADPELAIVEEDLLRYDAEENQEAIDLLEMEREDLEARLDGSLEHFDRLREEQTELEADRRPAEIRFEREVLRGKLRERLSQIAAVHLGAVAVGEIRQEFEETSQPGILEIASDDLAQLTCGKYGKIWTPLGERRLLLADSDGQNLPVERLSNGTREQLFLALRLGLVSEFAQRGTRLPMVLDDVLVNFDQSRTEAAIQTLIEFAERGHQVLLLTSHLHVARMCESLGIHPVWLPAHHAVMEHRRAG